MYNDCNNHVPPDPQNGQNTQNTQNTPNGQYQQNVNQGYPNQTTYQNQQPYQNPNQYPQQYQPPMQYGPPQYTPPLPRPGNGLATASLICSIFSLITSYMGPVAIVGAVLGIVAIITAACAKKKGFVGGMATAGLVMGIIGTVLSLMVFISCVSCMNAACSSIADEWSEISDYDWDWSNYERADYI